MQDLIDAVSYVQRVDQPPPPKCTVTYTTPGDTITYDLGKLQILGNQPTTEWKAQLITRDGQILVASALKPRWYEKVFALLIGLKWQWVELPQSGYWHDGQYGYVVNTPCNAVAAK